MVEAVNPPAVAVKSHGPEEPYVNSTSTVPWEGPPGNGRSLPDGGLRALRRLPRRTLQVFGDGPSATPSASGHREGEPRALLRVQDLPDHRRREGVAPPDRSAAVRGVLAERDAALRRGLAPVDGGVGREGGPHVSAL